MKTSVWKNKHLIIVLAAVTGIFALAVSWTMAKSGNSTPLAGPADGRSTVVTTSADDAAWSKAVLTVNNMSCSGCIDTIKKSVATLSGTRDVMVDLTSGTAEVVFDGSRVKDPRTIAKAITKGGYPADIKTIVTPELFTRELAIANENAKTHIAAVGHLKVPRKDYEIELGHARSRYEQIYGADTLSSPQGKQLLQRIESQIALRLVDEAVKLQEVDRAGYALPEGTVDRALSDFVKQKNTTLDALKRDMATNGYPFDYFQRKFENRVKLQNYLENIVLADSIDSEDRRQRYSNWLTNARTLAKVVYYDKNLEARVKASGSRSCGGGGSCSTSQ